MLLDFVTIPYVTLAYCFSGDLNLFFIVISLEQLNFLLRVNVVHVDDIAMVCSKR